MPSKGVDYYAFQTTGDLATFTQPIDWGKETQSYSNSGLLTMFMGNLQISESDIGILEHYGTFQWTIPNSSPAVSQYAQIAPLTGCLGESTLGDMMNTPSIFANGWTLSYGFYDSGPGFGSLTNQDQAYLYLTSAMSGWMGSLTSSLPALQTMPFATFALPGSHDSGTFDLTAVQQILNSGSSSWLVNEVISVLGNSKILDGRALMAITNLAVTQKEAITAQLNIGVRYFDFRPGYVYDAPTGTTIYHQHNFVPGYPLDSFLQDVFTWLSAHTTEIVVVSFNFQGFAQSSMQPTPAVIWDAITSAQSSDGSGINIGGPADLQSSYSTLISNKKRLIFLDQIGDSSNTTKYDSYNSSTYQTTNVANIIGAISVMNQTDQFNYTYTVLQLQGTASGIPGAVVATLLSTSSASSPLISTKANFDHSTYPWVNQNAATNLGYGTLLVLLNDFVDGGLAYYATQITQQRVAAAQAGSAAARGPQWSDSAGSAPTSG